MICVFDKNNTKQYVEILNKLREANISSEIYPGEGKLKKQMEYANKIQSPGVIFYGDDEIKKAEVKFRNLKTGEEISVKIENLANEIKNLSEKILRTVKSKGFNYIELDSVIETNHIVERSGETFRRFIFSFKDQKGNELCLRPDLTIASCLRYLNEKVKGATKVHYYGQAFRKNLNKTDPIIRNQIGFEIIGSKNEKKMTNK